MQSKNIFRDFAGGNHPQIRPFSGRPPGLFAGLDLLFILDTGSFLAGDLVGLAIGGSLIFTYAASTMPTRALASGLASSSINLVNRALGLIPRR